MRFFHAVFAPIRRLFSRLWRRIRENRVISYAVEHRFRRADLRFFDWPLLITVIGITLFGIVCIFSATSSQVTEKPDTILEMLETQSIYYPRQQLILLLGSLAALIIVQLIPYKLAQRYHVFLYLANVGFLMITLLLAKVGRGAMKAFVTVGSGSFQPSELCKDLMILWVAAIFARRKQPISGWKDLFQMTAYVFIPIILVVLQPDVGTALVYVAVYAVLVFVSGTDIKLIGKILLIAAVVATPVLWYALNNTSASESFRLTRFLIWLHPEDYPDEARQVINGQIALGSGGLFGKGIVSPGSYASLGYISDDHTDFIFAIVCESFGLVGGGLLVAAYIFLLARLIRLASSIRDPYGAYIVMGVAGMFIFHVVENIGMVIGLLPVTGIPLPFVSYGGSNLLTNMIAIGLVENVVIEDRRSSKPRSFSIHRPHIDL